MPVLTYFPKTRLSTLIDRFGGVSRDDAVDGAMKQLESMRAESDAVIERSISQVETLIPPAVKEGKFTPESMREVLRLCDQIVTLAGTFGYANLDTASKSLCDVADGLLRSDRYDVSPIRVHVQALRMLAPLSPPLSALEVETILSELGKIIGFYGFTRASDSIGKPASEQP
jgi:hypothetical protein